MTAEGFLSTFRWSIRHKVFELSQDMTKDDVRSLQFLMNMPKGLSEKYNTALEVLQYLEEEREVCYDDPTTFVRMMRAIKKEKWAVEMETLIDSFPVTCSTSVDVAGTPVEESTLPRPVQEQAVVPAEEETVTTVKKRPVHSPEQKKSNSLNRTAKIYYPDSDSEGEYDDDDDNEVQADSINLRSNTTDSIDSEASQFSCTCCRNCYRECYDRLSKELDQKVEDVYERCCAKLAHDNNSSNGHTKLTRTVSSASQKSTCSSGYGGSMYDPPIYIEPSITEESRQMAETPDLEATLKPPEAITSRGSSVSTTTSYHSFPPSPTINYPRSRKSSSDGYSTPPEDDGEGGVFPESHGYSENSICQRQQPRQLFSLDADIIKSPSLSETITKEMEVDVPELITDVDAKNTNKVYLSDPFPILGKGPKFQLHLYPTNFEHTYSVLYLVVVNWDREEEMPSELIMRVRVSELSDSHFTVKDITSRVRPHNDRLPPTPSNVDFKRLLLFPSLIPHSYLTATSCTKLSITASVQF